jgi:DNA-binding transcriptional regulator YdaS (Cro superfamily)
MVPDGSENSANLLFLIGIYSRVARQLGVHPSYVSRVARGERHSDRVYRAIAAELAKLREQVPPHLTADTSLKDSKTAASRELRQRLAQSMKSDPRLRRLSAVVIDVGQDEPFRREVPRRVSAGNLSVRLAANARMMAATAGAFERLSKKLERFPHVLSVTDAEGVVLFSTGTAGLARREHRLPGVDWSKGFKGPSSAARAIAAGVPVVVIGAFDLPGGFVPTVRMACPVRLSDSTVVGVLVLTTEVTHARAEHLMELSKIAKRVCKFVENGPMDGSRKRDQKARVQPFADAAKHLAMVLSLPQINPSLRTSLSELLGEIENGGRAALLAETRVRGKKRSAQGQSAS